MAIQTETDLGKVAIMPKGEWVIGVLYEILDMVTHNGNLYLSLKDTSVEPTDDGINWMLLMEGVPVATDTILGKVKPDGKTITIENGTLHGASQVPEGVTYVDLEAENQELQTKLPVDADTLEGHAAEYFATKKDLENIETSGGGEVTFPLDVPNSKEIKFIGVEDVDNGNKLVSHILYKNKNDLVLKLIDEKQHSEKELINITENDYGTDEVEINGNLSTYYVRTEGIDLGYIGSEKAITLTPGEAGNRATLFLQRKNENGYETLLEIDENGISHFFHSIDIKSGNLYLDLQQGIIFSQEERGLRWELKENSLKQLIFHGHNLDNEQIKDAFVISWDNVSNNVDACFNNLKVWFSRYFENFGHFIQEDTSTGTLNFGIYHDSSYAMSASVNKEGNWRFHNGINIGVSPIRYREYTNAFGYKTTGIETPNIFLTPELRGSGFSSAGILFGHPLGDYKIPFFEMIQTQKSSNIENQVLNIRLHSSDLTSYTNIALMYENEVHFGVPVTASNITKMASDIVTAQQEITEQDLQLIETQQMLTDQELENIETQQMLTEMDLEKIEGGQVV